MSLLARVDTGAPETGEEEQDGEKTADPGKTGQHHGHKGPSGIEPATSSLGGDNVSLKSLSEKNDKNASGATR